MGKIGRPNKLDPETKKTLLGSISLGLPYSDSCILAGIHYKTLLGWIRRGEDGKGKEYISFLDSIKRAKVAGKAKNIKVIRDDPAWQSKAWLLERQFPKEFGNKIDLSGTIKVESITVTVKGEPIKDES